MSDTNDAIMRAAIIEEYGNPSVLHVEEVPRPVPGPGEVLVKVKACSINAYDLMVREGFYKPNPGFPHILGGDISGIIEEFGPDCEEKYSAGSHVMLYWVRNCGRCEPCLRGYPTTCLNYGYLGAHYPGGYAEYVVAPEQNLIPLGDYSEWVNAAAFPQAFGVAWHMLISRANLRPGETILIQAVGSGIGMAGAQIARLVGAEIIASAGSDEKLEKGKELGAEHLINYSKSNLYEEIKRITNKRGVDVVFEHIGGDMWDDVVRSTTRNGRIVTCGGTAGYDVSMNIAYVFHKQLNILGSNSATRAELLDIAPFLLDGTFDPVVDKVFPLEEAGAAHAYVSDRQQFGKVVIDIDA